MEYTISRNTNTRPSGVRVSEYDMALANAAIYQAEAVDALVQKIAERARTIIAALAGVRVRV